MKCFNHPGADAVGLCLACTRGLCPSCALDLERGLACRDRCEGEVRRLIDMRDWSFEQPSVAETLIRKRSRGRTAIATGTIALAATLGVFWYLFGDQSYLILAVSLASFQLGQLLADRRKVPMDQFRLCSKCGYNLTGNTSGRCPECGTYV